jgi:hypothetical protein
MRAAILGFARVAALVAPPALAAHDAELSIMDDQARLGRSQGQIDSALAARSARALAIR